MIVDFHTHIFPDKLADRAISSLSATGGNVLAHSDGTAEGLIKIMNSSGVDKAVVLNIATNEKQMRNVNDFAIQTNGYAGRLVSFGSVYPHSVDAVDELYRLSENGIKGIKLHPEYQDFFVDDDKLKKIYETADKLKLITVFHSGMDIGFDTPSKASPQRFSKILDCFKNTEVILAHSGGYLMWEDVLEYLAGKRVYFDTSYCYSRIPVPVLKRIIAKHGGDKILFGSDCPWSTPAFELRLINSLGLSQKDFELITGGNAERILKL